MDPITQYVVERTTNKRARAYKRLDKIRARIKRERITMLFHGEDSFAGFLASVHLDTLNAQRSDLVQFLDSE